MSRSNAMTRPCAELYDANSEVAGVRRRRSLLSCPCRKSRASTPSMRRIPSAASRMLCALKSAPLSNEAIWLCSIDSGRLAACPAVRFHRKFPVPSKLPNLRLCNPPKALLAIVLAKSAGLRDRNPLDTAIGKSPVVASISDDRPRATAVASSRDLPPHVHHGAVDLPSHHRFAALNRIDRPDLLVARARRWRRCVQHRAGTSSLAAHAMVVAGLAVQFLLSSV